MTKHPTAAASLRGWLRTAAHAQWRSIMDVRRAFPHADAVVVGSGRTVTIFNIGGNSFRLITAIHYNTGKVFVREFLTHAEYNRDAWKGRN